MGPLGLIEIECDVNNELDVPTFLNHDENEQTFCNSLNFYPLDTSQDGVWKVIAPDLYD